MTLKALADGLALLGYRDVYHMREVNVRGHRQHWIDAIEAKYEGKGRVYGRSEYDALLGNFMVCLTRSYVQVCQLSAAILGSH